MHWKTAASSTIEGDHEAVRLDTEYHSYGGVSVSEEGNHVVGDLAARCSLDLGNTSAPADVFDCVNKPTYGCEEAVYRAGARCSKCHRLNRGTGSGPALHPVSSLTQFGTGVLNDDAEYDEEDTQVLIHNPSRRTNE